MRHYRRRLRTTNSVERLNEKIRRRERVIRIFPTRDSALRLMGALLDGARRGVDHGPPLRWHDPILAMAR